MKPVCQMSIKEVCLFHPHDMERVLKKGPWSFDGHLLVLGILQQGSTPKSVSLNHIPIWLQVHDVPISCMSITAGKQLGNFVGEYMEYDEKNNSNFLASYMCIRVMLDVRKPLVRFKKIKTKTGSHEVHFKYERLGSFCYFCGLLGHTDEICSSQYANATDDGTRLWSSELRAPVKKNGSGSFGSKWMREDGGPIRTAAPSQKAGHVPSKQHSVPIVINNSGTHISMAEAFTNPATLFPPLTTKSNLTSDVNEIDLMEEELNGTVKKRSRSNDSGTAPKVDTNLNQQSDMTIMEDVQRTVLQQTTMDQQHFLSAESGYRACRTKCVFYVGTAEVWDILRQFLV